MLFRLHLFHFLLVLRTQRLDQLIRLSCLLLFSLDLCFKLIGIPLVPVVQVDQCVDRALEDLVFVDDLINDVFVEERQLGLCVLVALMRGDAHVATVEVERKLEIGLKVGLLLIQVHPLDRALVPLIDSEVLPLKRLNELWLFALHFRDRPLQFFIRLLRTEFLARCHVYLIFLVKSQSLFQVVFLSGDGGEINLEVSCDIEQNTELFSDQVKLRLQLLVLINQMERLLFEGACHLVMSVHYHLPCSRHDFVFLFAEGIVGADDETFDDLAETFFQLIDVALREKLCAVDVFKEEAVFLWQS